MNTYNHIVLASYKLPRGYMPTNKSFQVFENQQQLYLFKYILASEIFKSENFCSCDLDILCSDTPWGTIKK